MQMFCCNFFDANVVSAFYVCDQVCFLLNFELLFALCSLLLRSVLIDLGCFVQASPKKKAKKEEEEKERSPSPAKKMKVGYVWIFDCCFCFHLSCF
jgi:hypothetical protein